MDAMALVFAWVAENAIAIFVVGMMVSGAVLALTGDPYFAALPFSVVTAVVVLGISLNGDHKRTEAKRNFLAEIVEQCELIGYREPLAFWESAQAGFMCPADSDGKKPVEKWVNVTSQLAKILAAKDDKKEL